jgi:hypothetical protein
MAMTNPVLYATMAVEQDACAKQPLRLRGSNIAAGVGFVGEHADQFGESNRE